MGLVLLPLQQEAPVLSGFQSGLPELECMAHVREVMQLACRNGGS